MKGALAIRKPVETLCLDMSSTNIATNAYSTLIAAKVAACSAIEILNPSSSPLIIASGSAGSEVVYPYTVPQGGSVILVHIEMLKGSRLAAKAIGANVTTGFLVINFFG